MADSFDASQGSISVCILKGDVYESCILSMKTTGLISSGSGDRYFVN